MNDDKPGIGQFFCYLREKRSVWLIAAVLIVGIILMTFGGDGTLTAASDEERLEMRVAELCRHAAGASEVTVMISSDETQVRGIAVVLAGGDAPEIRLKLTEMLAALFGIPSSAVSIAGAG
ncbi:MAG: hypothetical protein E7632_11645 [Ruminococcaceae bacterium]|nr:hypothetical protein [Oscillospiraceae bacterium]